MKLKMKDILKQTEFYVFCIIVAFAFIIQVRSGQFFTSNNLMDLVRSMIIPGIYAICALLSFVSTGADVSFPLIAALSAYIAVTLGNQFSLGVIPIFVIAIAVGCLIGCINGFFIVKYKFNSLIVTLGTSSICSGILFGTFEAGRTELPKKLYALSKINLVTVTNSKSGLSSSLPFTFVIMIVLYLIAYFILNYTMAGRSVYAVGGDEVSAERAGINVGKVRFMVFVVNGGIAAIAGLCYAMMSYFYLPNEYAGEEMLVIAAVVLGGTRMVGGIGTLRGCLLGTLLLTMVSNSLILLGISVYWEKVFIGAIIIIGTAVSAMQAMRASKTSAKKKGGRVNMNEAKKMKKSITLPFDDNSKRLIIILVVLLFVTGITKSSQFLNVGNIQSIGKQLTEYGLMSLGMGVCMLSGGIDLSTVYIANLCGISAGLIIQSNTSGAAGIVLACVVALVVGALCGIFNGFLVSFLNIPPMLATLGSYELYMGISIVLSQGSTVSADGRFNILSAMTIFGIPLPFILFLLCTVILTLIMSKTSFGNKVYLVGTNAKSSKFAGINVKKTTLCCYMISGILSAIAGLVSLSRLNSAKADFGTSYTMQTILVAVLGGINPDGGFGNIPGIAFAVIILQTLSSYLNQFPSISNYYRDMIWGVALLAVLVFNITISKKRAKKAASK